MFQDVGAAYKYQIPLPQSQERGARRPVNLPFGLRLLQRARKQRQSGRANRGRSSTRQCIGSNTSSSDDLSTSSSSWSSDPEDLEDGAVGVTSPAMAAERQEVLNDELEQLAGQAARASSSSYFSTETGLIGVEVLPVSRRGKLPRCYHCMRDIPRGVVRFLYSFDRRRPWKYIHAGCVVACVTSLPGGLVQAIRFITEAQDGGTQPAEIASVLSQLLVDLTTAPVPSS